MNFFSTNSEVSRSFFYSKIQEKENKLFWAFMAIYFIVMAFLCFRMDIWQDEAYSLSTTANPIKEIVHLSYNFEAQPPVYFILLGLWRQISDSIFFSRFLSLIFILFSAFLLDKTASLVFNHLRSKWLVVIFLLNPYTIWAGLEIRLYAFLIFLSFLQIYLFEVSFFKKRKTLPILYVLVGVIGVYTQYYFVFLLLALSLLLLIRRGWTSFFRIALWTLPVAISFIPNLFFIADQLEMHNDAELAISLYSKLRNVLASPFDLLVRIGDVTHTERLVGWFVRLFFLTFFFASIVELYKKFKDNKLTDSIAVFEILIPILAVLSVFILMSLTTDIVYASRYMTVIFPFFSLLFSVFFVLKKSIQTLIFGVLTMYFISVSFYFYGPPFIKTENNLSLEKYIKRIEKSDEPILFHEKDIVLSFKHFYKGKNNLIPIPKIKFNFDYYNQELKDTIEFKKQLDQYVANKKSFILVTGNEWAFTHEIELTSSMIDEFIGNNYEIASDTTISGMKKADDLRVRRLQSKRTTLY